ncbi:hypothetical protein BH09PSE4_BH09PSE4_13820 [soil metagenome]
MGSWTPVGDAVAAPIIPIVADDAGQPVGALEAIPLDDTFMVRTDQIDMGERLRPIDEVWADALGGIMVRDGQKTAIELCRLPGRDRWTLGGAGGHRLRGAQIHEIEYLRATIVSNSAAERRMREVSENLWRLDLDPIDRAAFLAELVMLHKQRSGIDPARDGRVASAAARWQKAVKDETADTTATIAVVYGWAKDIGAQIGLSERTVRDDLTLYRRLSPSLVARLRDARHPIAKNATQLRALAKLDAAEQEKVADRLLLRSNSREFVTLKVGDALASIRGDRPVADPEAKRLSAFLGAFARMSLTEKKGALAHLAAQMPAGFSLVEGGLAPAGAERDEYRDELLTNLDAARILLRQISEDPRELASVDLRNNCDRIATDLHLSRLAVAGGGVRIGGDA